MTNKRPGGGGEVGISSTHLVSSPRKSRCGKCVGGAAGSGGGDAGSNFKKGPWTAEEDALLINYVKNHGERHWNCVQKTGLMRCGKSCRLRWTNHLRPDLKKGAFSPDEEKTVLDLHAKLGNKWSKIAAELPGRTDNEVKNFWNTKIKRRMKAKLLQQEVKQQQILPPQQNLNPPASFSADHQQKNNQIHQHLPHNQIQKDPSYTHSLPSSPLTSLFSPSSIPKSSQLETQPALSPYGHQLDLTMPALNLMSTSQSDPIASFLNNPAYNKYKFLGEEDELIRRHSMMPFNSQAPISRFASSLPASASPSTFYGSRIQSMSSMPSSLQFNAGGASVMNITQSSGHHVDHQLSGSIANELPSFQIPGTINSSSSAGTCMQQGNSGNTAFGNDLMQESWSSVLQKNSDPDKISVRIDESKSSSYPMGNDTAVYNNHMSTSSPAQSYTPQSSTGMIQQKEPLAEITVSIDDDLPSLLDTFSSMGSPPQWYLTSSGTPMSMNSTGNTAFNCNHNTHEAATSLAATNLQDVAATSATDQFDWNIGTYCWSNMPGIS